MSWVLQLFDCQNYSYNYYALRTFEKITKGLILVALFSCISSGFAQKYWVGGTGKWGDSSHWSKTSGGLGGASAPKLTQDAVFDNNSGIHKGDSVIVSQSVLVKNLDFSSKW